MGVIGQNSGAEEAIIISLFPALRINLASEIFKI